MITLIPMAGKGERFSKRGYSTPKPLIPVSGVPMVVKAVNDLPAAEAQVFIVLKEHLEKYRVDEEISKYLPGARFIPIDSVTEGQACTAMLGLDQADYREEILIGACDNGMIFDPARFEQLRKENDVLVFTFRNNITVKEKPSQYGWVAVDENNRVTRVSVKKQISDTPMNDHAVIGAFWFREAAIFKAATEKMIAENRRINNEFYIDECINDAVQLGYKVTAFEVDKYICWGTPDDYMTYLYWESFFKDKR